MWKAERAVASSAWGVDFRHQPRPPNDQYRNGVVHTRAVELHADRADHRPQSIRLEPSANQALLVAQNVIEYENGVLVEQPSLSMKISWD